MGGVKKGEEKKEGGKAKEGGRGQVSQKDPHLHRHCKGSILTSEYRLL